MPVGNVKERDRAFVPTLDKSEHYADFVRRCRVLHFQSAQL